MIRKIKKEFANIELPDNRNFGIFFSGIFLLAGIYFYLKGFSLVGFSFFALTFLFCITAFFRPRALIKFNQLWMFFGYLLGKIISPIIFGIIFFSLFAPLSIIMRFFGRDELYLKPKQKTSYWIANNSANLNNNKFKQQF